MRLKRTLSTETLKKIEHQLEVGVVPLSVIARRYRLSANALSVHLSVARKRGLLKPTRMGRPISLNTKIREKLRDVPEANPFNPSDIGGVYDRD